MDNATRNMRPKRKSVARGRPNSPQWALLLCRHIDGAIRIVDRCKLLTTRLLALLNEVVRQSEQLWIRLFCLVSLIFWMLLELAKLHH